MRLAEQSCAQRQSLFRLELFARVRERRNIVADFLHVFEVLRFVGGLVSQHVVQRGLRTLDLRRDHRLFAYETVQKPVRAGHHGRGDSEAIQRGRCVRKQIDERNIEREWRLRRGKRKGHECADPFTGDRSRVI